MKILNLVREFEMQRMKDYESVKEYTDRLLGIANRVRLLGFEFTNSRIFEEFLVTIKV